MSVNLEEFQHLLQGMRLAFLEELPDRCDHIEDLLLALEKAPQDRNTFNEVYRGVHSLKGSGGTHGLGIITAICHQLENLLTDSLANHGFGDIFVTSALAHVDLLRQVRSLGRGDTPDFSALEHKLETMRQTSLRNRKAGLIADTSAMMVRIYQGALAELPVQLTVVDNGLDAIEHLVHQPYDFIIIGRELKELNGIAVVSALRASHGINHTLPVILVTSNTEDIPRHAGVNTVLARDKQLSTNLVAALQPILRA